MKYIILISLWIVSLSLTSQSVEFNFYLFEKSTKAPISGAHYFINNSTVSGISGDDGFCKLSIPISVDDEIIITHISYNSLKVKSKSFLSKMDTIYLTPSNINIGEVIVEAKRGKKWKRRYKKFKKALLGSNQAGKSCKILNPERIQFQDIEGGFGAIALDVLKVENKYLGYQLDFLLTEFTLDEDGSSLYKGYVSFKEFENVSKKHIKRRAEVYDQSIEKFLKDIVSRNFKDYGLANLKYENATFQPLRPFDFDSDITYDSLAGHYLLSFEEFLGVEHLNIPILKENQVGMMKGGLESQRFSASSSEKGDRIIYPKSYLYKLDSVLHIDEFGKLLNKNEINEFGLWAELKLGSALPINYLVEKAVPKRKEVYWLRQLALGKDEHIDGALDYFYNNWSDEFVAPLLELIRLTASSKVEGSLLRLLKDKFGEKNYQNYYTGIRTAWLDDIPEPNYYPDFKAELYKSIDPKFEKYFIGRKDQALIPFDEIVWGGVKQDGIPPLRNPKLISVNQAEYLDDNDIVFGIVINGVAKAYPKRILAWHEFFVDEFGDQKIAGVYCTLCGTMVAYDMNYNGQYHDLGTSGFLYQSNKLMYDKATQSLWSTIGGYPVVGPLVNKGIELKMYSVSTSTWGMWNAQYPNSEVLDIDTGFKRNYNEGEAYKDYFSDDNLMFPVKYVDSSLKHKDEVLVLRFEDRSAQYIPIKKLKDKSVYIDSDHRIVVVSKDNKSYKVYEWEHSETPKLQGNELVLANGDKFEIEENHLTIGDNMRKRITSHRSFWFAWNNYLRSIKD